MCELRHIKETQVIQEISSTWPPKTIKSSFVTVYEDHVPNVAVLIFKGELQLGKKGAILRIDSPTLIGVKELLTQSSSPITVKVFANSVISVFDRMSLQEKINENQVLRAALI